MSPHPRPIRRIESSVQCLRDEARRIRRDAERITGEETRRQMLDVAAQYEDLAEGEERQPR